METLRENRALVLLLLAFLILGSIYSLATPIFEAGDEVWHYPFVQWLATGHSLPVQDPAHKALWEQEGGQPPLYYALSAAATFWVNTQDMTDRLWRNPFSHGIGVPLAFGNKNLVVHTSAEDFPWHDTTLSVHLIRFLSLLMAAGTVALTYFLARELAGQSAALSSWREGLAWAAAAVVAFNPMFLFISASVNNDNLATLLATLGLLLTVQLVTRGTSMRRLLLLGVVIGMGALTKVSDAALAPLAAMVVTWLAWRRRDLVFWLRAGLLLALPALLIAGWWYARNYALYDDPLAFNVWIQIAGGRPPVTLWGLLNEFEGFRISFWGNFGGVNLIAPAWVYTVLDLLSLAGLVGLVVGIVRRCLPGVLVIPALWLALIFVSLVRWTLLTYASQGRLIFPAISAVAVLLVFGLDALFEGLIGARFKKKLSGSFITLSVAKGDTPIIEKRFLTNIRATPLLRMAIFPAVLLLFAALSPFFIIMPAYALPERRGGDAEAPNPVHISFEANDGQPELAGYELGRSARPGEELPVTLYWRTDTPLTDDLYVYIHLYDHAGNQVGQWDALPGNGMYPVQLWHPGELIVDRYRVPVSVDAQAPQVGRVEVGLARVGTVLPLKAQDPDGTEIVPSIGRYKIAAAHKPNGGKPARFQFGVVFDLVDFNVYGRRDSTGFEVSPPREGAVVMPLAGGDQLGVPFTLRARRVPPVDYTIFVHLVDPQGRIVAQQDDEPRGKTYPTSFWDPGEEVSDRFVLAIPKDAAAGVYQIEFGLYGPDGERLPATGKSSNGLAAANNHLLLGPLELK